MQMRDVKLCLISKRAIMKVCNSEMCVMWNMCNVAHIPHHTQYSHICVWCEIRATLHIIHITHISGHVAHIPHHTQYSHICVCCELCATCATLHICQITHSCTNVCDLKYEQRAVFARGTRCIKLKCVISKYHLQHGCDIIILSKKLRYYHFIKDTIKIYHFIKDKIKNCDIIILSKIKVAILSFYQRYTW